MRNVRYLAAHLLKTCTSIALVMALTLACGHLAACASKMRAKSGRPVKCERIEVFVKSGTGGFALGGVGVLYASEPSYAEGAAREVTPIYAEELLGSGIFSRVKLIPRFAQGDEEAVWWGRREGCDAVMESEILYLLGGSGAMPTRLEMRVRILDTRSGRVLWDLKQSAYSEPGWDLDLFWHTVSGSPAQKFQVLAKALAEQLSEYLATAGP